MHRRRSIDVRLMFTSAGGQNRPVAENVANFGTSKRSHAKACASRCTRHACARTFIGILFTRHRYATVGSLRVKREKLRSRASVRAAECAMHSAANCMIINHGKSNTNNANHGTFTRSFAQTNNPFESVRRVLCKYIVHMCIMCCSISGQAYGLKIHIGFLGLKSHAAPGLCTIHIMLGAGARTTFPVRVHFCSRLEAISRVSIPGHIIMHIHITRSTNHRASSSAQTTASEAKGRSSFRWFRSVACCPVALCSCIYYIFDIGTVFLFRTNVQTTYFYILHMKRIAIWCHWSPKRRQPTAAAVPFFSSQLAMCQWDKLQPLFGRCT